MYVKGENRLFETKPFIDLGGRCAPGMHYVRNARPAAYPRRLRMGQVLQLVIATRASYRLFRIYLKSKMTIRFTTHLAYNVNGKHYKQLVNL